jgi:hypothetical protein
MTRTVKADERGRVVLPGAKQAQVFRVERPIEGHYVLILQVDQAQPEPFPPGSLLKYFTTARNRGEETLLKGCAFDAP